MNNQKNHTLSFGVMTNGPILKKWQITAIKKLLELGCRLSLVIENKDNTDSKESKISKYLGKNSLYNLYTRFVFKAQNLNNTIASELLSEAAKIEVQPIYKGKYSTYFPDEIVDEIKSMKLDFILRFGFNIIRGEILNAAKYGVWSFHHDDEQVIRGGPPGFWEIAENHHINGILLQRLTDELDGGFLIRKGMYPVIDYSYSTHVNELMNYGVDILAFTVQNLMNQGEIVFEKLSNKDTKIYRFPRNGVMIKFLFSQLVKRLKFNIEDLFLHENWNIGVVEQNVENLISTHSLGEINFATELSSHVFAADVFLKSSESQLDLFYENFNYKDFKGDISLRRYNISTHQFSNPQQIIQEEYHLAFPYQWENNNEHYIIPESSQSGKLIAYKVDNEYNIIEKKTIIDKECVDAVIFKHGGYYWIFCTHKSYGTNHNLFAYYSKNPWLDWSPHFQNPIVSDARKARMAGNIIKAEGELLRPAQQNHKSYGGAIVINKILELRPERYVEEEVFVISPDKIKTYNKGIHTISYSGDFIAVDAKNYKFVFSEFARKIKSKLKR